MHIFFCILIFIMGTVFGSFFTLAVYRIPLDKNIVNERSFCPRCKHRLEFLDLIPVWSYLFLRGKCRYCGEKVRIRYLLLEVLSGLVFLAFYLSLGVKYPFFELKDVIYFAAFVMFYITIVIIAGIDKENRYIDKRVLLFGLIMQAIYQLLTYRLFKNFEITYKYLILLVGMFITLFIDMLSLKKTGETKYLIQIILFIFYIMMFIPVEIWWIYSIITLILIMIYAIYLKTKRDLADKPDILQDVPSKKIPIGFCLGVSAIIICILYNIIIL